MRHIMFYVFSTRSINPYLYRNKADFIMSIGICFCSGILNFVWMHITWDKYGCWSVLRVVVLKPVFSCACWENGCVFLKEVRFSIFWSSCKPIESLRSFVVRYVYIYLEVQVYGVFNTSSIYYFYVWLWSLFSPCCLHYKDMVRK